MLINGILLLYHHYLWANATTILEHVNSFERYSSLKIWSLNTEFSFPDALNEMEFKIIVLHYSLFGYTPYNLDDKFLKYLAGCSSSHKIVFFQDEYRYCKQRFDFINQFNINTIYTLLEPDYFQEVYGRCSKVTKLINNLTGYVSDDLISLAKRFAKPDGERICDIGYRGRPLELYMGRGAQEKTEIASGFLNRAHNLDLKLNIATEERHRIYGKNWYRFLGKCRGVLGVEAGASIFDLEDSARLEYEKLIAADPQISPQEISANLDKYENIIYNRTISPRHFEAAAMRNCQILFEGKYAGIMQPLVHYIPLKKDFSNFDEVIRMFKDIGMRRQITNSAHHDLIDSGLYSYRNFIAGFDREIRNEGFDPKPQENYDKIAGRLNRDLPRRRLRAMVRNLPYYPFPGRRFIKPLIKSLLRK